MAPKTKAQPESPTETLGDAIRALIRVIEAGPINSEQQRLLPYVRLALGDLARIECPHRQAVYEEGDRLICQDCRADLTSA